MKNIRILGWSDKAKTNGSIAKWVKNNGVPTFPQTVDAEVIIGKTITVPVVGIKVTEYSLQWFHYEPLGVCDHDNDQPNSALKEHIEKQIVYWTNTRNFTEDGYVTGLCCGNLDAYQDILKKLNEMLM